MVNKRKGGYSVCNLLELTCTQVDAMPDKVQCLSCAIFCFQRISPREGFLAYNSDLILKVIWEPCCTYEIIPDLSYFLAYLGISLEAVSYSLELITYSNF